mmetsp:Transcript_39106/g.70111  ORF Transcript_39106/g.70111 Transcript_39106/m.70111 type:complete len:83 (-) Transcript_39106:260-508(-)
MPTTVCQRAGHMGADHRRSTTWVVKYVHILAAPPPTEASAGMEAQGVGYVGGRMLGAGEQEGVERGYCQPIEDLHHIPRCTD